MRRGWWTALAMVAAAGSCGHACGEPKSDWDAPACTNLHEGAPCSQLSVTCEEKVQANPQCNVAWECRTGTWTRREPRAQCNAPCPAAYTTTNPGACEAKALARRPDPGPDAGLYDAPPLCEYPEGVCGCDKSAQWKCLARTVTSDEKLSTCPTIRVSGGTKGCPSEDHWPRADLYCVYGDYDLFGAVSSHCEHNSWVTSDQHDDDGLRAGR